MHARRDWRTKQSRKRQLVKIVIATAGVVSCAALSCTLLVDVDEYTFDDQQATEELDPEFPAEEDGDAGAGSRCEDSQASCDGDIQRVCADERWIAQGSCELGCEAGRCRECRDDERRCVDGRAQICEGGFWSAGERCAASCERGACVESCTEERTQCSGVRLERCVAGFYVDEGECPSACAEAQEGASCAGECRPLDRRCAPGSKQSVQAIQVCGESGFWLPETTDCADSFCFAGACLPCDPAAGALRCGEAGPEQCSDSGQWMPGPPCGGETPACLAGVCVACAPGERRCQSNGVETCSESGTGWQLTEECSGATPLCLAATSSCTECQPGTEACQNNLIHVCDASGSFQNTGACSSPQRNCGGCGLGESCARGADCGSGVCIEGSCALCATNDVACLPCEGDGDCLQAGASRCTEAGICGPCSGDADCSHLPDLGVCRDPGPSGRCVQCADAGDCSDGLFCTGNETCNTEGQCIPGTAPCDGPDGDADCTETCSEVGRCVADPAGTSCGGGNVCDGAGQCATCLAAPSCGSGGTFTMGAGATHQSACCSFTLSFPTSLWPSAGPITDRDGEIREVAMPTFGSAFSRSFDVRPGTLAIQGRNSGTYVYTLQRCTYFLGGVTPQCEPHGLTTTVIVP